MVRPIKRTQIIPVAKTLNKILTATMVTTKIYPLLNLSTGDIYYELIFVMFHRDDLHTVF